MNNYSNYKDVELIPLLREKKPASDLAFHEIYGRYSKRLYMYCVYKLEDRSHIEDILQETWYIFDNSVKGGKSVKNILSFLIGIARNLINNYLKTENKRGEIFVSSEGLNFDTIKFTEDDGILLEQKEQYDIVMNAIYHLDDNLREVLILKQAEGLSYEDIAKLTEESVSTVQRHYGRAIEELYKIFKPYIKEKIQ